MRRSTLVLVLAVAASLMQGVVPANATVFEVEATDYTVENGRVVDIEGFIACSEGMSFIIRVNVQDEAGNKAVGRASGECSGNNQTIQTVLGAHWDTGRVDSSTGFTQGECLLARGQARTTQDGDVKRINNFIGPCNG